MRILLSANHRYPAGGQVGTGLQPTSRSLGGSAFIHDWLAKGLAELGHEVLYLLPKGSDCPLPRGIQLVSKVVDDVDILHYYNSNWINEAECIARARSAAKPWVVTCHADPGASARPVPENWIFVSRTLAGCYNSTRYVMNGIDPEGYIYSESKEDYFLFISNLGAAIDKGLLWALRLSSELGFPLIVAGSDSTLKNMVRFAQICGQHGARFVGDVRGLQKAELFAGARALLFPTKLNEAAALVIIEALMSGTPVIASKNGACPEMVSAETGFTCETRDEWDHAIERVGDISPLACRTKALRDYHYRRMAADYAKEYEAAVGSAVEERPFT
jgi:glycosyltransferase involved in cell wall biosynthesis